MTEVHPVLAVNSICGTLVHDRSGEQLGRIQELMVDAAEGCIVYAVITFGGLLGVGEKLFGVPWRHLDIDAETRIVTVNAEREQLEAAPGLDKDAWPAQIDDEWWLAR
jgi:sporulation protein YlmC with PRC-barrel domain